MFVSAEHFTCLDPVGLAVTMIRTNAKDLLHNLQVLLKLAEKPTAAYEEYRLLGCYDTWLKNRRFGRTYDSVIKVTGLCELGTTLAVTSNQRTPL
jgi:hypothetical protein